MTPLTPSKNTPSYKPQPYPNAQTDEMLTPKCLKDKYQFIKLIGEGANAKTYLAVSTIEHQRVVVKALKNVDQFKSIDLFKREAATLSHINVEGVPKFYDFITSEDNLGECYIVQEYFNFPTLQDLINKNKKTFSESETLNIITKLANILDELQSNYTPPIIHRDIKPSNILYDPKTQKVMLIDFGAVANPAKKSQGSTVAGTLGFMAPEQLMGECTIQSDYYALGATALYMLTGISPVDMDNDPDNPFQLIATPHLMDKAISLHVQTFINELINPDLASRPQNSKELLKQLDRLQTSPSDFYAFLRKLRQRKLNRENLNQETLDESRDTRHRKADENQLINRFLIKIITFFRGNTFFEFLGVCILFILGLGIILILIVVGIPFIVMSLIGLPFVYLSFFELFSATIFKYNIFSAFESSNHHLFDSCLIAVLIIISVVLAIYSLHILYENKTKLKYLLTYVNVFLDTLMDNQQFRIEPYFAQHNLKVCKHYETSDSKKTMKICHTITKNNISYKECVYSYQGEWFYYIGDVKLGDILELTRPDDSSTSIYYEVVE